MRAFVTLYSKAFLETDDDSWSARPSSALLQRLHNGEGSARWIACISPPIAIGSEPTFSDSHISIGDPVPSERGRKVLYLPQWFMESIGVADGDEVDIDFKRSEEMPKATSLNFRMLGPPTGPDLDIRDLLEEPLSQLGVLQVGQIIPVPALEGTMLVLESCEPDGLVFLDGAEIALDIVGDSSPSAFAEEPLPSEPSVDSQSFDDTPMIPLSAPSPSPAPIVQHSTSRFPPKHSKFIPFQGVGHKLG
jgi:hypothetical protein